MDVKWWFSKVRKWRRWECSRGAVPHFVTRICSLRVRCLSYPSPFKNLTLVNWKSLNNFLSSVSLHVTGHVIFTVCTPMTPSLFRLVHRVWCKRKSREKKWPCELKGRFPFDQIFLFEIPGIPCDEWQVTTSNFANGKETNSRVSLSCFTCFGIARWPWSWKKRYNF